MQTDDLITLAKATLALNYYRHLGFFVGDYNHSNAQHFPYCNVVEFDHDTLVDAMTFALTTDKSYVYLVGTSLKPSFSETIETTLCVPDRKNAQEGYEPKYRTFRKAEILGKYRLRPQEEEGA